MTKLDRNEPMDYIDTVIAEFKSKKLGRLDIELFTEIESFLRSKLEGLIEEIRNQMYRGATKDEVHRILDALKGGKE